MQRDIRKTRPVQPKSSVGSNSLLAQLITITDLTLRNSKDTQEQKEALALKELLEAHQAQLEAEATALPTQATQPMEKAA